MRVFFSRVSANKVSAGVDLLVLIVRHGWIVKWRTYTGC